MWGLSFTLNFCRILLSNLKLKNYLFVAAAAVLASTVSASTIPNRIDTSMEEVSVKSNVVEVVPVETELRWILPSASYTELAVLNALQDRGIEDRNAIATVMGNIKQESKFNANICEGGARIPYHHCRSGGYGLIQWTSSNRYHGLGRHANRIGLDPSTTSAQISFLFTELQWKRIEPSLKANGMPINFYMGEAYYWLGWGIHGNRTTYAHQYAAKLTSVEVPVT